MLPEICPGSQITGSRHFINLLLLFHFQCFTLLTYLVTRKFILLQICHLLSAIFPVINSSTDEFTCQIITSACVIGSSDKYYCVSLHCVKQANLQRVPECTAKLKNSVLYLLSFIITALSAICFICYALIAVCYYPICRILFALPDLCNAVSAMLQLL